MTEYTQADVEFATNAISTLRQQAFANMSSDGKHRDAWRAYGYVDAPTFKNFHDMYDRFGIASAVVDLPVDECFSSLPVIEGSNEFNAALKGLNENAGFISALCQLDKRQRVGKYACLVPEIKDSRTLAQSPRASGWESVQAFKTLYEGQIEPSEYNPNGSPKTWQITEDSTGDKSSAIGQSGNIHMDRVMVWAEGSSAFGLNGKSAIRACFNSLVTLEKIIGAGGEGFFKSAKGGKFFSLKDGTNAVNQFMAMMGVTKTGPDGVAEASRKFNEKGDDYNRALDAWTMLGGVDVMHDSISLPSPEHFAQWALNDVSASSRIPGTILIGQQTGRLASDEDQKQLAKVATARRTLFLTPMITRTIKWLQRINILPAGEFTVEWDDLFEPSIGERITNFNAMAGGFSAAGYEPNLPKMLEYFNIPSDLVSSEPSELTEGEEDDEEDRSV